MWKKSFEKAERLCDGIGGLNEQDHRTITEVYSERAKYMRSESKIKEFDEALQKIQSELLSALGQHGDVHTVSAPGSSMFALLRAGASLGGSRMVNI
jgi:hypothetical protein